MGVPEEIRAVKRPVNTTVEERKTNGPLRYAVRAREGSRNGMPVNGRVIGYIIDGKYVERAEDFAETPSALSYGSSALIRSLSKDIEDDLLSVFPPKSAQSVLVLASVRVMRPKVPLSRVRSWYEKDFLSVYCPGLPLSKSSLSVLLDGIGKDGGKREKFYSLRVGRVAKEHHIAIDGMLKQDTSAVNDLSGFSYKSRIRGTKDISVLYAFDVDTMEPVCAEAFPGNQIDASSYPKFVSDCHIDRGLIVDDKGFPPSKIKDALKEHPDLHYLTPVRRNSREISEYSMLEFDAVLDQSVTDGQIVGKKAAASGRFLYSFRDASKAAGEEKSYLERAKKDGSFSAESYEKDKRLFGVIVFESDVDLSLAKAYLAYQDRWQLELIFDRYKNDECLDQTRVQGDYSVQGNEFVNFVSTLITARIISRGRETGVLSECTFGEMMDDLHGIWRKSGCSGKAPLSGDSGWVNATKSDYKLMERLGLSKGLPKPEPKKRGRKKKAKGQETEKPKRHVGRPTKKEAEEYRKMKL